MSTSKKPCAGCGTSNEIKKRQLIERRIARRLILDAVKAGYSVNVYNGEERGKYELPKPSTKIKEILEAMFATDDETLYLFRGEKRVGWVYFVYGNDGWDVICDYTVNLEHIMAGVNAISDKYQS